MAGKWWVDKMGDLNKIIVPPNPGRLMESMRDTGYQLTTAIADILDNSITANADVIEIWVEQLFGNVLRVCIIDNGCGMDKDELVLAMTYGSPKKSDPKSLGKFGLGLKTASSAFCKRYSAVSKKIGNDEVWAATWDLESVEENNEWALELNKATEKQSELLSKVAKNQGTLILWEKVDRILREEDRRDDKKRNKILQKIEKDLSKHIARVFQRFLSDSQKNLPGIGIFINGVKVEPWDPFCIDEEDTHLAINQTQKVELENGDIAEFTIKGYVLPRTEQFSTPEKAQRAEIKNDNQGIYIYRENRLIDGPHWMELVQKEPHYSLARLELSFSHDLDEAFKGDIKKSRISLNPAIVSLLEEKIIGQVRNLANQRYREGRKKQVGAGGVNIHQSSNRIVGQYENEITNNKITGTDVLKGVATIENSYGTSLIKLLKPEESKPNYPYIVPMANMGDGVFWQPIINDNKRAVGLNSSHEFYEKIYLPAKQTDIVIQSFDYLLWALSMGELDTVNDKVRDFYEDMRISVSKTLRRLSERLPEVDLEDGN